MVQGMNGNEESWKRIVLRTNVPDPVSIYIIMADVIWRMVLLITNWVICKTIL